MMDTFHLKLKKNCFLENAVIVKKIIPQEGEMFSVTVSDAEHPWSFHVQSSDCLQKIASNIK